MKRVALAKLENDTRYPHAPFHPARAYPELAPLYGERTALDGGNRVYGAVRDLFLTLGLDRAHEGTATWNPLRDLVGKGKRVLIKPNLVLHQHMRGPEAVSWICAHASILRAFADYALLAVGSEGFVTLGDTPLEDCLFEKLVVNTGLDVLMRHYEQTGFRNIRLSDFRTYESVAYPDGTVERRPLAGDPNGYTDIDLGTESMLQVLEDRLGTQNYYTLADHTVDHLSRDIRKRGLPNQYHAPGRHVYRIPNTVLDADCVLSVAKLKTHKFSGVTLCLKNMIGITEGKSYLPHRRPGTASQNGDSYASPPSQAYLGKLKLRRALLSLLGGKNAARLRTLLRKVKPAPLPHEVYSEPLYGDWHGNDTIWRSTVDLNQVLFFASRSGIDFSRTPRSYLGCIDGIIGMDHEAPMMGTPVQANLLLLGRDPVALDTLGTWLMGFDPEKIPTIVGASKLGKPAIGTLPLPLSDIAFDAPLSSAQQGFEPTKGWRDYLRKTARPWRE